MARGCDSIAAVHQRRVQAASLGLRSESFAMQFRQELNRHFTVPCRSTEEAGNPPYLLLLQTHVLGKRFHIREMIK